MSWLAAGSMTRIFDHDAAKDNWADLPGAGGELDKQAQAGATEKALDSLLAHKIGKNTKREDATKFTLLTTSWAKGWRMKDGSWKMKVRFVGREYKRADHKGKLVLSWSDSFW